MQPEKILIADDDENLLHLMAAYLQRCGYAVESASDAYEALGLLHRHGPFAVLVTDLSMPGMSGLELLREARKLDERLEVIVVSAVNTAESAITAMREDGAYNYLLKPFEMISELSLAVERAADHRRLQIEREALRAELRAEARHLQALLANTGEAILSADAQGQLRVVNPRAARLIGQDDLVGREASSSLPPPLATLLANWQVVGDYGPALMEIPWSADSTHLVRLTPLADGNGSAPGWMMMVDDTTPLKRQAEFKMQLLKKIANKIHFPLSQAMFALSECKEPLEEKGGRSAASYYRLVQLLTRVQKGTDDLLALAQAQEGTHLHLLPVDLSALLEESLKSLPDYLLRDKQLTLDVRLADDLPPVQADSALLLRLLEGLLQRAVARSRPEGQLYISTCAYQDQVWVKIRDAGPESAEADLLHIFDHSSAGLDPSGENDSGLELALAKTIVNQMGGQVWLGGEGPLGSSLIIGLPVMVIARAASLRKADKAPVVGRLNRPEVSPHATA